MSLPTILEGIPPLTLLGARRRWYHVDQETLALTFDPATPYEAWEASTAQLLEVEKSIQWLVGDALLFGEAAYGERYAQVIDPRRYTVNTVQRMVRTARAIPAPRRRGDLDYTIHSEVATLPEADQEILLDYAREHDSTSAEIRMLAQRALRAHKRERYAALGTPAAEHLAGLPTIEVADARAVPLDEASVDLICTSPPYGLDIAYGVGDILAHEWPGFLAAWLEEAWRILKPQGRLALNIPLDTARGGYRPTYHQALAAALAVGFTYSSTVVWMDNQTTKGNRGLGSIDSSARPYHVSQVEMILLLSKGPWGPSSDHPDDITHAEWQAAGRGPWTFSGEAHAWEGYPAAFPLALPLRLIRYLSRVGDVVVDPFCGSGTTLVAASRAGRRGHGFDRDPLAVASSRRRLAMEARHERDRERPAGLDQPVADG